MTTDDTKLTPQDIEKLRDATQRTYNLLKAFADEKEAETE